MKALVTNRTDRVMLAVTAFSGVMFLACVGLMASNYRPLLGEDALAKDSQQEGLHGAKNGRQCGEGSNGWVARYDWRIVQHVWL